MWLIFILAVIAIALAAVFVIALSVWAIHKVTNAMKLEDKEIERKIKKGEEW